MASAADACAVETGALDAKLARLATAARCPLCGERLTAAEQADGCPRCGVARPCPPHTTWPAPLKRWCVAQLLARYFLPWLTAQSVWERLLKAALGGEQAHARPGDHHGPWDGETMYRAGLARAEAWNASGAPVPGMT